MRTRATEQVHAKMVHSGDWHDFAVCRTCFWEGERSGKYNASRIDHWRNAQAHTAKMHRRWVRANRWWRRLSGAGPVVHLVAGSSGQTLRCCDREPLDVRAGDEFTFKNDLATCGTWAALP